MTDPAPEDPLPRPARWQVVLGTSWAIVCLMGLAVVVTVVALYPSDARRHRLAEQLRAEGQVAAATAHDDWPPTLTFRANGQDVTVEIDDGVDLSVRDDHGAVPVVYLPSDPQTFLTRPDLDYYADDALPGGQFALVLGLAPAVGTLLAWLACGRPRWGRYVADGFAPELPDLSWWP